MQGKKHRELITDFVSKTNVFFGSFVSFCSEMDQKNKQHIGVNYFIRKNQITDILNNKSDPINIHCAYYRYHYD